MMVMCHPQYLNIMGFIPNANELPEKFDFFKTLCNVIKTAEIFLGNFGEYGLGLGVKP